MFYDLEIKGQNLYLLPEKAIFWKQSETLIVADLHLGKSGHFRKNGIPVPTQVNSNTLVSLNTLIEKYSPKRLLILGDLFHSRVNNEWEQFWQWKKEKKNLEVFLTIGNHDRYESELLYDHDFTVVPYLIDPPFQFQHDQDEYSIVEDLIIICGHIHPSYFIRGKGRQRLKFNCFVQNNHSIIMPAFGEFTGSHRMNKSEQEEFFVIVEDEVIKM